jgi:hypothetical protein
MAKTGFLSHVAMGTAAELGGEWTTVLSTNKTSVRPLIKGAKFANRFNKNKVDWFFSS